MKPIKPKSAVWLFAVSFSILVTALIGVYVYSVQQSARLLTYTFTKDNLGIPQEGLSVSVSISKKWDDAALNPDNPAGAQYDGVITNNEVYVFKNWSATLVFSEPLKIDSSWNGDFSSHDNQIIFVPTGVPATVASYNSATFGAVIYSKKLLSLESYTLSGYKVISIDKLPIFWILVALLVLWAIILIVYIVIRARTAVFLKRLELDSKIITQSMNTLTGFIDAKDSYTKGHSTRVAAYAAEIAHRMKLSPDEITQIYYIALMHDCGKISIPDSVLKKPGKLTDDEYGTVKSHTTTGDELLLNFTAIPGIRDGAHYHHERFDGMGYPLGLHGNDIPLCARIICVADSFDAMSSNRCYRSSLSREEILKELKQNAGKQFDPAIVPYMIDMVADGFADRTQEQYPKTDIH